MERQLLSGNAKYVLSSMLICCLWVCAVPAAARAQAKFSSATCSVQVVKTGPMVQSQIKCTAQVTELNPTNASTTLNYTLQSSTDGGKTWSDLQQGGTIVTSGVNGTANFDSGWLVLGSGSPPKGVSYRAVCNGSYI